MHTRRMVVAAGALCTLLVSTWMLPAAAAAEGPRAPEKPLAEMAVGASRVDWQPAGDYEHLTLTVAGPEGVWLRKEFAAGQPASLELLDQNGKQLPDGAYTYELRFVPGDAGGSPKRPILQVGSFAVRNGSFVSAFGERKGDEPQTRSAPTAPEVIHDKSITPANACIGPLCVPGDDAGLTILRLKGYTGVGILFEDVVESFPQSYSRDWLLQANPNLGGPDGIFLQDLDAGTTPFLVFGNSPDYSLVVGTGGNIGVGTSIPAKDVHVISGDTPTLRLDQSFGANPFRSWDLGANHTEFFIKDVTNSSSIPFRIKAGAPSDTLVVTSNGRVGIGTATPSATFHVSAGEVRFPPGNGTAGATVFNYYLNGNNYIRGTTIIADSGGSVGIGTASPASKLHVDGGDIRVSGGSFIDDGVTLNAPDYVFEPSYSLMPLAELREFVSREKHLPNVPAAADIKKEGLNLSQFQMRLLEKIEELALYTLKQEEDVRSLRDENQTLKARLEALEKAQASTEPR